MNIRKRRAVSDVITILLFIMIAVASSVLTYSWVMSMVGSQSAQTQTQIRIDFVDWGETPHTTINVCIRNTGSVGATIASVDMKENKGGAPFVTLTPDVANGKSLEAGTSLVLKYSLAAPSLSTAYVIRVTATTGFFYELVVTSPSS